MDKLCHTCGDIGYEVALVTCTGCKVGCEHLYCLRKFCLAEPDDWCCEMCNLSAKLPHDPKVCEVKEFYIKAAAEEPLPTDPATIASWKGSFILNDQKTSIGFHAHPTSQCLSKVKEFSKKMPKVLEFDLCVYKDFLGTVFKGSDPDDRDIGLYFFPDSRISPRTYMSHLEQLSGNFFLRNCIDGVELLVFTSKVLHKDYLKRNKCDFYWE